MDDDESQKTDDENIEDHVKYRSYISFCANLDNLIWKNITNGIHITMVGGGFLGAILSSGSNVWNYGFINKKFSLSITFLIMAAFYIVVVYTMYRMRTRQEILDKEIGNMEKLGYFNSRSKQSTRLIGAPYLAMVLFLFLAMACMICFILVANNSEAHGAGGVVMKKSSFLISVETMDNGEVRHRFMDEDGSGYIKTISSNDGGWQKSHHHNHIYEFYFVEKGKIILTTYADSSETILKCREYNALESFIILPRQVHNIKMGSNAVIHTLKLFSKEGNDWEADQRMDDLIKK